MPELPFSNGWIGHTLASKIPENSVLHLGILNSLRHWNFFKIPESVTCYSNTGGFGIDGIVSTLVGSSLAAPEKLHYLVVGDLAFFYDLNAIANKNVGKNIRILLINNGCGTEFKNYNHFAAQFGSDADSLIAAKGHYGQQSSELIKCYAKTLGFEYMSASNKEEFLAHADRFVVPEMTEKPMLLEVFTMAQDESDALYLINHIMAKERTIKDTVKTLVKGALGEKNVKVLKKIMKR